MTSGHPTLETKGDALILIGLSKQIRWFIITIKSLTTAYQISVIGTSKNGFGSIPFLMNDDDMIKKVVRYSQGAELKQIHTRMRNTVQPQCFIGCF